MRAAERAGRPTRSTATAPAGPARWTSTATAISTWSPRMASAGSPGTRMPAVAAAGRPTSSPPAIPSPYDATVVDLDADGDLDVLALAQSPTTPCAGSKTPTAWAPSGRRARSLRTARSSFAGVSAADLDGDGDPDLAARRLRHGHGAAVPKRHHPSDVRCFVAVGRRVHRQATWAAVVRRGGPRRRRRPRPAVRLVRRRRGRAGTRT